VESGVYCENFVMIGLMADAGDNFKNRAPIPFAPCTGISQININFLKRYRKRLESIEQTADPNPVLFDP
jgi:hypothetical protein